MSSASDHQDGVALTVEESEGVLEVCCVKYGFCLRPESYDRLADSPPNTPRAFVDAVIAAYGLDPLTVDRAIHEEMQVVVREVMARHSASAGSLPPNTSFERTREG